MKKPAPFKIGDVVYTTFYGDSMPRRVTKCVRGDSETGWLVMTSPAETCPTCLRRGFLPVLLASSWFTKDKPT